jgi:LysM repeat protein
MHSNSTTRTRRLGALVGPALIGAFVLASCGSDSATTQSTIDLSQASTAFVVRPPATTDPALSVDAVGGVVTGTQEYVVQAGDYPLLLVERFNISLDDLIAVNEWGSVNEFPGPGTTIIIPPGGTAVAVVSNDEGDSAVVVADGSGDVTVAATIPDAGDNCGAGSYTIEEGDTTRTAVADKFDVSVDELDAANASTPGYSAFYPGLEIVIPAKDDC